MTETDSERLRKLANKLGYSYEELSVKGIEAMLEWVEGGDEKQIPKFILEILKKQNDLTNTKQS